MTLSSFGLLLICHTWFPQAWVLCHGAEEAPSEARGGLEEGAASLRLRGLLKADAGCERAGSGCAVCGERVCVKGEQRAEPESTEGPREGQRRVSLPSSG